MEASSFGLSHDTKSPRHGLEDGRINIKAYVDVIVTMQYQNPAKKLSHASAKLDVKLYVAGVKRQT